MKSLQISSFVQNPKAPYLHHAANPYIYEAGTSTFDVFAWKMTERINQFNNIAVNLSFKRLAD